MDKAGIEIAIVSLNAPAIQQIPDPARAIEVANRANNSLAEHIEKHRDRFRGFAALPMQDPDAAKEEVTRCSVELGFVGALVNGFTQLASEDSFISTSTMSVIMRSGRTLPPSSALFTFTHVTRCRPRRRSTRDIHGFWAPHGRLALKHRHMRYGSWALGYLTCTRSCRLF
jgi:hypothetical protein